MTATFDAMINVIGFVDSTNHGLAHRLQDVVGQTPEDRFTMKMIRSIRRETDPLIAEVYGATQSHALSSTMYRGISGHLDAETARVLGGMFDSIRYGMAEWGDPQAWNRIVSEFRRRAPDDRLARLYLATYGTPDVRYAYRKALGLDPNRRWVDPKGYRLSDRVWASGRKIRRDIDIALREGMRRGDGPVTVARTINEYLNPDYAPVKYYRDGRVIRTGPSRKHPSGSTPARRLARTELARMNTAATEEAVRGLEIEGAGIRYSLSPAHPRIDICDGYARGSSDGFPSGVYRVGDGPRPPVHPQCICYASPYVPPRDEVFRQLREKYL